MYWLLLFTGNVPRGVFVNKVHRKPENCGAKSCFAWFLCIAKRVTVSGVNSNWKWFRPEDGRSWRDGLGRRTEGHGWRVAVGWGLATTFTDTQKNRDSEIAFSAILDLGNINYSLEFFCPYREASHGWSRVLPCSFRRWIACPLYSDHSVSRSRSLREPHEV